jgi:hypothetical protein
VRVELTQFDPVPGYFSATGQNAEIDLTEGTAGGPDETTLIYSVASGYGIGFTPQKVLGAKRLIVSQQQHSAGLDNGFIYENQLYKGAALNSLAEGVYVDRNADGQNSVPLERVDDIQSAKDKIGLAYEESGAVMGDSGRLTIIGEVLKQYL